MKLEEFNKIYAKPPEPKVEPKAEPKEAEVEYGRDDTDFEDIDRALTLLEDIRGLLVYLGDSKLVSAVQWQDRQEIHKLVDQIAAFQNEFVWNEEKAEEEVSGLVYNQCPKCGYKSIAFSCPRCKGRPKMEAVKKAAPVKTEDFASELAPPYCTNFTTTTCIKKIQNYDMWCGECKGWVDKIGDGDEDLDRLDKILNRVEWIPHVG